MMKATLSQAEIQRRAGAIEDLKKRLDDLTHLHTIKTQLLNNEIEIGKKNHAALVQSYNVLVKQFNDACDKLNMMTAKVTVCLERIASFEFQINDAFNRKFDVAAKIADTRKRFESKADPKAS